MQRDRRGVGAAPAKDRSQRKRSSYKRTVAAQAQLLQENGRGVGAAPARERSQRKRSSYKRAVAAWAQLLQESGRSASAAPTMRSNIRVVPGKSSGIMRRLDGRQRPRKGQAKVAELVDALALGASGATRESSSLSFRTRPSPQCPSCNGLITNEFLSLR